MVISLPEHWYQDVCHPNVCIVAAHGTAQSLDEVIRQFKRQGRDVSPKLDYGPWYLVVVNDYVPFTATLQLTQNYGTRRKHTEIVCTGLNDGDVIAFTLDAARLINFQAKPLTDEFIQKVLQKQNIFKVIYDKFAKHPAQAAKHFSQALSMRQQTYHSGTWKKDRI